MDRHAHWQGVYESKAEAEVSWFQALPAVSLALIGETGLARDARLVDIGGGMSRLVDHLVDAGWQDVTVLDIAPAALEHVRRRLGARAARVTLASADVTRWTPSGPFDLWHDRAVFHFLTDPFDRAAYARTMAAAVPAGGHAIVGTFAADGPERCSGLPVRRYDGAGLAGEFAAHFRPESARTEDHVTPAGKVQRFQFCRLRRL